MKFIVEYTREEQRYTPDGVDYTWEVPYYTCVVNASTANKARATANGLCDGVAMLTDCLSEDELQDVGAKEILNVTVTPLSKYLKWLSKNYKDLYRRQGELDAEKESEERERS